MDPLTISGYVQQVSRTIDFDWLSLTNPPDTCLRTASLGMFSCVYIR